jgi:hypothetical protein
VLEDGREFWCADDFRGMLLVEADADELALVRGRAGFRR